MTARTTCNRLQVATVLYRFIEDKVLPGTGIASSHFWQGFDAIAHDLAPKNAALLAERDAQIAELQQAVIELANERDDAPAAVPGDTAGFAALEAKLSGIETKMLEQERTIRHTLTMLIEWIEADDAGRAAA